MRSDKYLLPYSLIVEAASGDANAINRVLKHCEGYIAVLATRRTYDDAENPCNRVDWWMQRRLETKLVSRILAFDLSYHNRNK